MKLTLAPTALRKHHFSIGISSFYPQPSVFKVEIAGWRRGVVEIVFARRENSGGGGGVTECLMEKQFSLFLHRDENPKAWRW